MTATLNHVLLHIRETSLWDLLLGVTCIVILLCLRVWLTDLQSIYFTVTPYCMYVYLLPTFGLFGNEPLSYYFFLKCLQCYPFKYDHSDSWIILLPSNAINMYRIAFKNDDRIYYPVSQPINQLILGIQFSAHSRRSISQNV